MPHLYIANCTLQDRIANLRIPEVSKAIQLTVPRGRQVRVTSQELNSIQIDSIVVQLAKYGARLVEHLGQRRANEDRIPYILSSGSPVPANLMAKVIRENQAAVKTSGERFRKEAAIASSNFIENEAPGTLRMLDTVVAEATPGTIEKEADEQPLSEGLRVIGSGNTDDEHREAQQQSRQSRSQRRR